MTSNKHKGLAALFLTMVFVFFFAPVIGLTLLCAQPVQAIDPGAKAAQTIRIGFVGSLSSFAGNYGTAVLEGARLAVDELDRHGTHIELKVEDDQSVTKNSVNSYIKLAKVDRVQAIVAGTWWANSFVKQAERDQIPLLSCETIYNDDVVLSPNYFILNGDLSQWVRVYQPLVQAKGWKRGAVIRYVSGFGATLAREMESLFSRDGREFVEAIEYNDINMADAADIVLKLRALRPDAVYVDAQPGSLANLLRKLKEAGLTDMAILTNSIAEEVVTGKLFDPSEFSNLYFSRRATYDRNFAAAFHAKYQKEPYLSADLGYYAIYLAAAALKEVEPIQHLKRGAVIKGKTFSFDQHNVYAGIPQEVFQIRNGKVGPWDK